MRTGTFMIVLATALALTAIEVAAHGNHDTGSAVATPLPSKGFGLISPAEAAARVEVDERGGHRFIRADGLADHVTGQFPNRGNPNAIAAQSYSFRMPLKPARAQAPTFYPPRQLFGIAINGVAFDPNTAEFWNNDRGWMIEALSGVVPLGLDRNNAHVQPDGAYHYHAVPTGLVDRLQYRTRPAMIGWAADGFPIYAHVGYRDPRNPASGLVELRSGYRLRQGVREGGPGGRPDGTYARDYEHVVNGGDLDQCNGREGVTPEFPGGTYYYVVTPTFPFVPRCFVGTADASFTKAAPHGRGGPGGPGGPPGGRGGPPPGYPPPR